MPGTIYLVQYEVFVFEVVCQKKNEGYARNNGATPDTVLVVSFRKLCANYYCIVLAKHRCTTQLAKLSFNHSIGGTHS